MLYCLKKACLAFNSGDHMTLDGLTDQCLVGVNAVKEK